jgi:hypothetical protein
MNATASSGDCQNQYPYCGTYFLGMVHCSLRITGTFMPPYLGCSRHNVQNENAESDDANANPSTTTHLVAY